MKKPVHIRCADCIYTRQDIHASIYTQKRCKRCALNVECPCNKKMPCSCGKGCKYRGTNDICPMQILKWAAIECANKKSMYYRSLLNVNIHGHKLTSITWDGCICGKRRDPDDS